MVLEKNQDQEQNELVTTQVGHQLSFIMRCVKIILGVTSLDQKWNTKLRVHDDGWPGESRSDVDERKAEMIYHVMWLKWRRPRPPVVCLCASQLEARFSHWSKVMMELCDS